MPSGIDSSYGRILFRSFGAGYDLLKRYMRLLLIGLAVTLAVVPTPTTWIEAVYSREAYLVFQNLLTPISNLTGIALFDVLLVAAAVGLLWWWGRVLWYVAAGGRWRAVWQISFNTIALAAGVYLVFLLVWGLNYRREPLTTKLDYEPQRVSSKALTVLAHEAVERLNSLHLRTHAQPWPDFGELPVRLGLAFEQIQQDLGARRTAVTGLPKQTLLTPYFKRAGVDGMINPFSLEVLVNSTVLTFERPFVVAHEWAHLAGYANESEANFVGWLTCLSGDAASRYSAWVFLFPHLLRHLDPDQQAQLWEEMDMGPMTDFRAVSERISQTVPIVRINANRVYDRYLRANRVDEGIASYGAVVDLVLGSTIGEAALADSRRRK
jgi:hypothetical protein